MNVYLYANQLVVLLQILGGGVAELLESGTGTFAFILFAITLYAWWRRGRQQPTLLIVSLAFLLFFVKQVMEIIPVDDLHSELVSSVMDFLTLALFFVALVVRPRRAENGKNVGSVQSESQEHGQ